MKLFEKLFCKHKWKLHAEVSILYRDTKDVYMERQTLICEICGKIKQIKL